MIINNVGYNHCHDTDFIIERPEGSGDNLLLLLKTDTIFTINGKDIIIPADSFFIYRTGRPQFYRCMPNHIFSNDWVHFTFEGDEEKQFLSLGLKYETPIRMDNLYFMSFCIKSLAREAYSEKIHKKSNIYHYMFLIFNEASEKLSHHAIIKSDNHYEMLSTIRNKIYSAPFEKRTITTASHELRMSPSNFQHLYKKYFGVTFMQDLINSRIDYAKMLLLSTNLNSNDIAKQCGYNHYAHFARQFKATLGITPLEFRKNHNVQSEDITANIPHK